MYSRLFTKITSAIVAMALFAVSTPKPLSSHNSLSPLFLRYRKSAVKTNPSSTSPQIPSIVSAASIFCFKSKSWLQIDDSGTVSGSSKQSYLQIQSVGQGLVHLFNPSNGYYLRIDSTGLLSGTKNRASETVFLHVQLSSGFDTFASHKYYMKSPNDMYVAIRGDRRAKKATRTSRLHKTSWFVVIPTAG